MFPSFKSFKTKQLNVCILNLLPEVSILPNLVTIGPVNENILNHHLLLFGLEMSFASGDKIYPICLVTSQDQDNKGSCEFMTRSTSQYVTKGFVSLWVEGPHGELSPFHFCWSLF